MKLFRGAVDTIKRVYRYEKTTGMDVGALQGVMLIFAVVLFLIDIETVSYTHLTLPTNSLV